MVILLVLAAAFVLIYVSSFLHQFDPFTIEYPTADNSITIVLTLLSVFCLVLVTTLFLRAVGEQSPRRKAELRKRLAAEPVSDAGISTLPGSGQVPRIARVRETGLMAPEFIAMIRTRVSAVQERQ